MVYLGIAMGTGLRDRLLILLGAQVFEGFDEQKEGDGDDPKVNDGSEEETIIDGRRTRILCGFEGGIAMT